jgi:hypothetical protein
MHLTVFESVTLSMVSFGLCKLEKFHVSLSLSRLDLICASEVQ